jgi:hypothetical protein
MASGCLPRSVSTRLNASSRRPNPAYLESSVKKKRMKRTARESESFRHPATKVILRCIVVPSRGVSTGQGCAKRTAAGGRRALTRAERGGGCSSARSILLIELGAVCLASPIQLRVPVIRREGNMLRPHSPDDAREPICDSHGGEIVATPPLGVERPRLQGAWRRGRGTGTPARRGSGACARRRPLAY